MVISANAARRVSSAAPSFLLNEPVTARRARTNEFIVLPAPTKIKLPSRFGTPRSETREVSEGRAPPPILYRDTFDFRLEGDPGRSLWCSRAPKISPSHRITRWEPWSKRARARVGAMCAASGLQSGYNGAIWEPGFRALSFRTLEPRPDSRSRASGVLLSDISAIAVTLLDTNFSFQLWLFALLHGKKVSWKFREPSREAQSDPGAAPS